MPPTRRSSRRPGPSPAARRGRRGRVADQRLHGGHDRRRHRDGRRSNRRPAVLSRRAPARGGRGSERSRLARGAEPRREHHLRLRHPDRPGDRAAQPERAGSRGPVAKSGHGRPGLRRQLERCHQLRGAPEDEPRHPMDLLRLFHQVPAQLVRVRLHRRPPPGHGLRQRRLGSGQHRPRVRATRRATSSDAPTSTPPLAAPAEARGVVSARPTATARTAPRAEESVAS